MADIRSLTAMRYAVKVIYSAERGEPIPEKPDSIGYKDIFEATRQHSYAGAVFSALHEELTSLPAEAYALWEKECMSDTAKNIAQLSAFASVEALLSENKIYYLPLKGIILKSVWKNPLNRPMSDIDIFVGDKVGEAQAVLCAAGYELRDALHDFHTTVKKRPYVSVELHSDIYKGAGKSISDYQPVTDGSYRLKMSHTELLTFIVRHAHHHYVSGGSCGIRLVFDLRFYFERYGVEIDRAELEASLKENGLFEFYGAALSIGEAWFDGKALPPEYSELEEYMLLGGSFGNTETKLRQTEKDGTTLKYFFSICFPPYKNMASLYPVLRRWKILLPLYYVRRGFGKLLSGRVRRVVRAYKDARKENK
ncbi:MAG: nucleotidyltransferase family protein [Clostridia bacterium]|nr:nucleotidyltransferase family protein [Clostridia bacterium]